MGLWMYILTFLPIISAVNGRFDPLNFFHDTVLDDLKNLLELENLIMKPQYDESIRLQTLRYVLLITRHGSRSPIGTYPTDPYPATNLKYWPEGYGQLTKYGKQQMYNMGRLLRKRYKGFLSPYYSRNDTYVISEYYDRDFMSAATLLAGLYPPVGFQVWNKEIPWQPIPIFERAFDITDITFIPTLCPRFYEARTRALNEYNLDSPNHADLLKYLSEKTGQNISVLSDVFAIFDTLSIQAENGFKLPAWAEKVYDILRNIYARAFQVMNAGSDEQKQLLSGPLLKQISDQLNTKASGKMDPDRKLYINAAHDTTLVAILNGLGINDPFFVETSAYMVFELHKNSTENLVKVMYFKNGAETHPEVLNIPDCPNPCSLEGFNASIQKLLELGDWNEECMKV